MSNELPDWTKNTPRPVATLNQEYNQILNETGLLTCELESIRLGIIALESKQGPLKDKIQKNLHMIKAIVLEADAAGKLESASGGTDETPAPAETTEPITSSMQA